MPFTSPPTAVVGSTVTIAYTNTFSDNDNWFDDLIPAPSAANQVPISSSTSAAAWGAVDTANIADDGLTGPKFADDAITTAKFASGAATTAKLTAAISGFLAQSTLLGWVRKASEIPTGWSRASEFDGRLPVGAGSTFGETFVVNTDYGSSWAHTHTVALMTGGPSALYTNLDPDSPGTGASLDSHTHDITGSTGSTTWLPPSRAVVYVDKD